MSELIYGIFNHFFIQILRKTTEWLHFYIRIRGQGKFSGAPYLMLNVEIFINKVLLFLTIGKIFAKPEGALARL